MSADRQLRLLGGLQIIQSGAALSGFVSTKAPAVLAYLAVTRRPHPREALPPAAGGGAQRAALTRDDGAVRAHPVGQVPCSPAFGGHTVRGPPGCAT
ncbi:MAG: hypothetical protein IT318_01575 [Anaerolineales bacterium]|nr:hypothetical protein [Anaerolineales bacterium]